MMLSIRSLLLIAFFFTLLSPSLGAMPLQKQLNEQLEEQLQEPLQVHCQGPLLTDASPTEINPPTTVILIGGGPAFTTWNLQPVQEHLAKRLRVCRWDMRGVGDNRNAPLSDSSPVLEQWLQDMQQTLPQQPVILWGQSWGALQSLLFASRYPERVERLVLSNPVDPALLSLDGIEQKRLPHSQVIPRLRLEAIGTELEVEHLFRRKLASYFLDGEQGWEYAQRFGRQDANKQLNARVWQEYRSLPLSSRQLAQVADKVHTLIYCQHDVLMPENLQAYREWFPASHHRVMTGCMHFPWEERPGEYFEALDRAMRVH